jgi:cell division protein FtsW
MGIFRRSPLRTGPVYHEPDWWLLAIVLTLVMFGAVMIFSATTGMAAGASVGGNPYLVRQLIFVVAGFVGLVVAMHFDYHRYRLLALPGMVVVTGLLVAVLVVGQEVNGAQAWFDLGPIQFQPSELAKPVIIAYLAGWLCTRGAQVQSFSYGLLQFVLVMGVVIGLVMLEPDLGTAILLTTVGLSIFFVGGAQLVHFFGLLLAGGGAFLALALSEAYRRERLLAFLDPESNLQATGWHLLQARLAFGSGGLFGVGLGESRQKFTWLPAPHNDAIFAIIGEELGLVGCVFVLGLFVLLGYRGYRIARRAPDQFGMLIGVGVTTWLIYQAVFNIGGITAAIPFTGITLPFVSYGGSSLVISMTAIGMLLNVSRQSVVVRQARASAGETATGVGDARAGAAAERAVARQSSPRHVQSIRPGSTEPFR